MSEAHDEHVWVPYVVAGKEHPGVMINAHEMERDGGASFHATIAVDGHTNPHIHSGDEVIDILKGIAELEINDSKTILHAGASIRVLAGSIHRIRNCAEDILVVRATFDPPFKQQITTLM